MELEELRGDIEERERLLSELCKEHPLYPIMYNSLLERKEKYEIMVRAAQPKKVYVEEKR